jgi:hypothetical protein
MGFKRCVVCKKQKCTNLFISMKKCCEYCKIDRQIKKLYAREMQNNDHNEWLSFHIIKDKVNVLINRKNNL